MNTLVGHWHNASPVLACNFLSRHLCDPFLYTLCQCVRIIRRLANVQLDVARDTVAFAVNFHGAKPFGPAGALKHYFNHVGWELDTCGNVKGPDHLQCNILCDSTKRIVNVFKAVWPCGYRTYWHFWIGKGLVITCLILACHSECFPNVLMKTSNLCDSTLWEVFRHRA